MEIKAKRDELLATLYWTQSIVERRNTMPILGNVLIEAQKGSVRVTATDLEVGVRGSVDAEVVKEGTVTVNAKKIYEIIREVPNEQVQLKRLDNDWVEIRSGKSVFKIVGMDAKEFPQFPKFDAKSLSSTPAATVHEMIERTIFSVSMDETRYSLNGVFVEEGDGGKIRPSELRDQSTDEVGRACAGGLHDASLRQVTASSSCAPMAVFPTVMPMSRYPAAFSVPRADDPPRRNPAGAVPAADTSYTFHVNPHRGVSDRAPAPHVRDRPER